MNDKTNHAPIAPALSAAPNSAHTLNHLRIKHTRVGQMMHELGTLIYPGSQDNILLTVGPPGVGKSTLAESMVTSKCKEEAASMNADAGLIPAIYVEAPSSGESDFSWRLFYQRILQQLDGDFSMSKTAYGIDTNGRMVRPRGAATNSLAALRTAVERALRARQTQFLVIDEAAHIIRQTRRNRLEIQLDTLKSLANECGTQMLLIGSYDLYQLVSLSGQLARRTHVLHFERYRQDNESDVRAFHACVKKFQDMLPDLWGEELVPHANALLDNTLGCIGTLSAVLTRAAMLAQKDGHWKLDALRRALLTDAQRDRILSEIMDGENAIDPSMRRTLARSQSHTGKLPKRSAA